MNDIERLQDKINRLEEQLSICMVILADINDNDLNGVEMHYNDRAFIGKTLADNGYCGYEI